MGTCIVSQVGFICPDGETTIFDNCLKKCRLGERCLSKPTLRSLGTQRKWTGLPSTTQLLCGTREAYLKIVIEYYEQVQILAWILLGNKVHKGLEESDTDGNAEIVFKNKAQSGIADYYDPEEFTLWDYKVSGSYKVNKALGLVSRKITDPNGARYKRNGPGYKKGDIKKIAEWYVNDLSVDMWQWILQTNRYAIWLEESGKPVKKIKMEVIVRDGGLKAAATYGIDRNIVLIDIPLLDKDYVLDYYRKKATMLRAAFALSWSPKCNNRESWDGRKCEKYCPVAKQCNEMPDNYEAEKRFIEIEPEILC